MRRSGEIAVYGSNGVVGLHNLSITEGPTIVIGRKGSIGEVHLSENSCWPIDTTYFIDQRSTACNIEWLSLLLSHLRLARLNRASGVPGLNREDAYKVDVLVPETVDEQAEIAINLRAQLALMTEAQVALKKQQDEFDCLKIQLMAQTFKI